MEEALLEAGRSHRRETSTTSGDELVRFVLVEKYRDLGLWGRHYSTVRMMLATFFATLSFAMIKIQWDTPDLATASVALITAGFGALLFSRFTKLSYSRARSQRETYNELLRLSGRAEAVIDTTKFNPWNQADGYRAAIAFVIVFFLFDVWWIFPIIRGRFFQQG
jgi:hypothetical protein